MKNENGAGSVYKQKGKRRKPWIAVVTIGYTEKGKQIKKSLGTSTTKREAQELLLSYSKNPNLFSKKTFKEVKDAWWKTYTKRITSKTTISTTEYRLRHLEELNTREIANIKLFELQELFDKMKTSWSFKNGCKSALNMIFDYALKLDLIENNKVKFIEIGKKDKHIQRKIFSKEEIDILWANKNKPYVYIILILIHTGLRIGELINLKVEDIDFTNNVLHIRQSKTETGIRDIPINQKIVSLIKSNLNPTKEYFVYGDTTIKLSYSTFKPRFQKILKELKLPEHTIHDTRHTTATLLNNADANPTSIIRIMGHSKFQTTDRVYTHKDKKELEKAINLI